MNELRLLFDKSADGDFAVRIVPSSGNASEPVPFKPFLDDDDFEDLRWYLEDFMDLPDGGSLVRAHRVEEKLRDWGRSFYNALFKDGDNRELLNQMQADAAPRLLTLATRDVDILRLPWELMSDSRGPLVRQDITIRRQLETAKKPIDFQTTLPLRILYVVSRPGDLGFIDPRLSSRSMLDALAPLGDDVHVDFCRPPTLPRLEEMLSEARRNKAPYHLVHFDGHGTFLPEIELGALCFEKPDGATVLSEAKTDYVRADRLGDILATYKIPLVILEACRTGTIGKLAVFRAVAPRLIEAGVGSVISMSHAVHVEAARILLERFYRELVTGCTVGQALEQGRAALIANPHRWIEYGPGGRTVELKDWYLPHLYQRSQDLKLVPPRRAATAAETQKKFDVFLSHQHTDSARVERIAMDLKNRHGLRVWLDKWECGAGPLHDQCVQGVAQSRFTLLAVSQASLNSKWVAAEQDWARADDPQGWNVIPLLLEDVPLPPDLKALLWQDFRDPANDSYNTGKLAALIRPAPVTTDRKKAIRFSRDKDDVGAFPPAPIYGFQGRAHELYELERQFRSHRAVLLYAMGGMGKTALAGEAAQWWTRSGLFPDGACFLSFEQPATAERIIQVLGAYLDGNEFNALPEDDRRRRARELFRDKSVLMIWDNFESVLPAFQSGAGAALYSDEGRNEILDLFRDWTGVPDAKGRLLITCRPEETDLSRARKHELRGLARPDSLWLLVGVLETAGVDLNDPRLGRDKLNLLLDTLADHPLSIELVGPHLKNLTPEEIIADFRRLLAQFKRGAGAERNESLLASLEFSKQRLSEAAQAALPWLGLFSIGVFEQVLLAVSELDPQHWDGVRGELEATALVRVERDIGLLFAVSECDPKQEGSLADLPVNVKRDLEMRRLHYLRFHPTLAYTVHGLWAVGAKEGPPDKVKSRFVGVYRAVLESVKGALTGSDPSAGLKLLACEEANFRTAMLWVLEFKDYQLASAFGQTFSVYLEMSGRLQEHYAWVKWLSDEIRKGGFSKGSAERECEVAKALFAQGKAHEAIHRVENLLVLLRATTAFDASFQVANAQQTLGEILEQGGLSERALPILQDAIAQWEALVVRAGDKAKTERTKLAVTLGSWANALLSTGRLGQALVAAERGLGIYRDLGNDSGAAYAMNRCVRILTQQGRYVEADTHSARALTAARLANDKPLEGQVLQSQGIVAINLRQFRRAASLLKGAMKLFQEMTDDRAFMRTCGLLGVVELQQGRSKEARTWFELSLEMEGRLGDAVSQTNAALNIAIICRKEGEAALLARHEKEARSHLEEARRFVWQALQITQGLGNEPQSAHSLGQLAQIHLLLGELDEAERYAQAAREIVERLSLKDVHFVYHELGRIARARGNAAQSAEWERKRDTAKDRFDRLAEGPGGIAPQFLQAIQELSTACARAGFAQEEPQKLQRHEESALAQIEQLAPPLPDIAPFLRRIAAGQIPSPPTALPAELQQLFTQLIDAIRESRGQS